MKLGAWLKANPEVAKSLHADVGVHPNSIDRYVAGSKIPKREQMVRIYVATGGAVTPNDFYDLPELTPKAMAAA